MSRFLLDVNALLALLDPMHVHHHAAHAWYAGLVDPVIVTCGHVENGVLRVASQPKYPNSPGTTTRVREMLRNFIRSVSHEFCRRDASLLDDAVLIQSKQLSPNRVADLYLLAIAAADGAKLATFDHKIPAEAVAGGAGALELIPF
jgi:toxin-antitoxin system PIN domain toxin